MFACATDLLASSNFSLEASTDDLLPHIFDAADKELLKIILLHGVDNLLGLLLRNLFLQLIHLDFDLSDLVSVVCFEDLDVALRLLLDLVLSHA